MSRLNLYLFGTPRIEIDGQAVRITRRKATALFAYLAVTGVRHNRDALATLLWPEKGQSSARAELRRALYFINKALGNQWLETDPETAGLSPKLKDSTAGEFWLDVAVFQQPLKTCETHKHPPTETCPDCIPHLETAVDLYTDHFMAGFSLPDCPEFDEWQFFQAEELRNQLATTLKQLSSYHESLPDYETAIAYTRRWLTLDPLHEPAHQQLMTLFAQSGQKASALRQYDICRQVLADELGIEPAEETQSLYQRIRTSTLIPPPGSQPKSNLPLELTSFIGRRDDILLVQELLQANRLVTVIGHGGIGKTRLAIQVSRAVLDRFPDGIWLVDLAPLSDPEKVPQTAARAVGIPVDTGAQALEALLNYLYPRQMLLVLDNCEHLIEACAQLAEAILTECPQAKILATSREPLGLPGESVHYLPSLSIPKPDDVPAFDQLMQFEAIKLFGSRASAVQSQFAITTHNASDVAQVCTQLAGIPLAIELAAAWVRTLSLNQISHKLSENIDFLRASSRTSLSRHQTLRACLDWSFDLLSPSEQDLLQTLSVFAGGWTLGAVEVVYAEDRGSQFEVLKTLDQLVAKSLVIVEHHLEIETRYRLLEPVRQYAHEKLHQSGEMESVRDRHLAYYQYLVEQAKPHLRAHRQIEWMRRLERELGNIRVALDWAYSEDGPIERVETGLRIAAELHWFWQGRNRHLEGFQHLSRLLDLEQQRRGDQQLSQSMCLARAWALTKMVWLTDHIFEAIDFQIYDFPGMLNESLALFSQLGEAGKLGFITTKLVKTVWFNEKLEAAFVQLERYFCEFEKLGDKFNMAICMMVMGHISYRMDNDDLAEKYYQKAIILCEEIGDRDMTPLLWTRMGHTAYKRGEPTKARAYALEATNILKAVEDDLLAAVTYGYSHLGSLYWKMGDYPQAEKYYQSVINRAKNQRLYIFSEIYICCIAMSQGDYHKARISLNEIYQSIQGRDFGEAYTMTVRVLAELEWGTENYSLAEQWLSELQRITVSKDPNQISSDLGWAKVALSKMDWYLATKHTISVLKSQLQLPFYFHLDLYEDKYAVVFLSAVIAFAQEQAVKAARLLGSADQSYQFYRLTFPLFRRQLIDQTIADTHAALDEATFTIAWEEGRAMDLNEALAYALEVMEEIQPPD